MKRTVALYSRTSTDRQDKGLESQMRALEDFCKNDGITEYKFYSDNAQSGTLSNRPELNRLMSDCEKEQIEAVVVYSFSRFARSTSHLINSLNFFRSKNIAFISITEKIDTSSPIGLALFTIISAIAQLERDLISERVRNGLINAKAKGKILGRPTKYDCTSIEELLKSNLSLRQIAKILNCSVATAYRLSKTFRQDL